MARWLLVSWATNAVVLAVAGAQLGGVSFQGSVSALIVAAAVFGVLNTILRPIMRLLTLPLAVVTLGVAWFFVAMILWLTDVLVHNFSISGFWDYVLGDGHRLGREPRARPHLPPAQAARRNLLAVRLGICRLDRGAAQEQTVRLGFAACST